MSNQNFDEIIDCLTDADRSLTTPLLKIKVFAHRIKNHTLGDWVNKELAGYEKGDALPNYRVCKGTLIGTYINGNMQVTNQPIPKGKYLKEYDMETIEFKQGIESLEKLIVDSNDSTNKEIGVEMGAEVLAFIQQGIREEGNPYFSLVNSRKRVSINQVVDLVSNVRNNMLNMMLEIDEKFTDLDSVKNQPDEVSKIVTKTIINAGAGSIINTGDNNSFVSNISITQGDKNSLSNFLADNGVQKDDINELMTVIDQGYDETISWQESMIEKAKSGIWQIQYGVAGSLLAEAIKGYLGMS